MTKIKNKVKKTNQIVKPKKASLHLKKFELKLDNQPYFIFPN